MKFDLFPRIGKSATGSGVRAPSDFAALLPRKPDSPASAVFYSPSSHRLIIDLNTSSPFQPKNSPFTAWSCLPSSPLRLLRLPDNWPQYPPFHLSFAKKLSNSSSDIPHQCHYIYDRVFCPNSYHILFCFWRTKFYRPTFLSKDYFLVLSDQKYQEAGDLLDAASEGGGDEWGFIKWSPPPPTKPTPSQTLRTKAA